ncbi:hypothetical protein GW17_00040711 [Ensete ventricosum]|nr:hypothetical protein GW17_00040711 [Ensete ventricosum]RZS08199.1 hypothetical protein BHM03_00039166 [Ensete ventricosum]
MANARPKPSPATLLGLNQKDDEPQSHFVTRFAIEIRGVLDTHPSLNMQALLMGLRSESIYITAKALVARKHDDHKRPHMEQSRGQPSGSPRRKIDQPELSIPRSSLLSLNSSRTFFSVMSIVKASNPINTLPELKDQSKYYLFHCDYKHDTKECHDLRNQIEELIRRGHSRYLKKPRESSPGPHGPMKKQIDVIVSGPASSGDIMSGQKVYARADVEKRHRQRDEPEIALRAGEEYPDHVDALAISVGIAYAMVKG